MRQNKQNNRGISLIEMLVTVGIIGISILAIYFSFIFVIKINQRTKNLALAYEIAHQEMEAIHNFSSDLENQTDGNFLVAVSNLSQLNEGVGLLTIQNYEEDENIKEIIIKVQWVERTEISKQVILTTLVNQ